MDIPWQLWWTIGPLLSQRFPLASAKAKPMGGFHNKECLGSIAMSSCTGLSIHGVLYNNNKISDRSLCRWPVSQRKKRNFCYSHIK